MAELYCNPHVAKVVNFNLSKQVSDEFSLKDCRLVDMCVA